MTSLVLLAVMLDRPALTMRNVALAALAILIAAPESLFDPSFQMSFAAVIGLIALYEWLSKRERGGLEDVSLAWRALRMGGLLFWGAALTTIVAGFAVAPFAVYHFHRMTHFGLLANLIATPLISVLVMPMALVSLIAIPFGLEAWPLKAMGVGIELMVATGEWVAGLPGAVTVLPAISGFALAVMVLGGLWFCLWHTRVRLLGIIIAAFGLALAPGGTRPDILIESNAEAMALRGGDGNLMLPPAMAANYSVEKWLLADGDGRDPATMGEGSFHCDLLGCIGTVKGKTVALIRHPAALAEDCRIANNRHRAVYGRKEMPKYSCHCGSSHAADGRCARALYRRVVHSHRNRRRSAGAKTVGPRAPAVVPPRAKFRQRLCQRQCGRSRRCRDRPRWRPGKVSATVERKMSPL